MTEFKKVLKHNPNHDQRGRFATSPGGRKSKPAEAPKKEHAAVSGVHDKTSAQHRLDGAKKPEAQGELHYTRGIAGMLRGKPADMDKVAPEKKPQEFKDPPKAQAVLDGTVHMSREEAMRREMFAQANDDPFAEMMGETSHALPSDLVFFHGTASTVVASIKKKGLIAGKGGGADSWALTQGHLDAVAEYQKRPPSVFMSVSPVRAAAFAKLATTQHPGSEMALLEVRVPKDKVNELKPDEKASMAYRYEGRVDPSWISVINEDDLMKNIKPLAHSAGLQGDMVDVNKADTVSFYVVIPCMP